MSAFLAGLKKFALWIAGGAVALGGIILVILKLKEAAPEEKPVLPPATPGTEAQVQGAETQAAGQIGAATATAQAQVGALNQASSVTDEKKRLEELAKLHRNS